MKASELFSMIDQQRVWGQLVGHERIGDRFFRPSWMGADKTPDCRLGIKGDKVRFYDPSKRLNLDILDCYKMMYPNDGWKETVDRILTWSGSSAPTAGLINSGALYEPTFVLKPKVIEWTPWGIEYWEKRGVSVKQLSNPETLTQEICGHEISGINDQGDYFIAQYGQGFVYHCNGKVKCYYPFADKTRKFKGRFNNNDVWLVDRSERRRVLSKPESGILLIAKSSKDFFCWVNLVDCDLMTVPSETVFPTPDWLMTNVRMKYEKVVIVFDCDEAGVKGANELQNLLLSLSDIGTFVVQNWPWPDPVTKDLDKYRVEYGHEQTVKFLIQNNFHKIFQP